MATVFKRGGKSNRGGYWYVSWFDHTGHRRTKCTRTTDKATAERIASKHEASAALRRDGVVDANDDRYATEARRPLSVHLHEYKASLVARGKDDDYIAQNDARAQWVVAACEAKSIGELTASAVQLAIRRLRDTGKDARDTGKSLATCNSYLRSIKGLTRWMFRDKRSRDDALAALELFNEATDRRRERRELSPDELTKLIDATTRYTGPAHTMAGVDRAMLYRVAVGTGFRASELRSLRPESFELNGDSPTITVEATHSKRRRTDVQPIRRDLAEMLSKWLTDRPADRPVFHRMPGHTARMLRQDLAVARNAWIDEAKDDNAERKRREESDFLKYRDGSGAVFDFHAFRHAYISTVVNSGASVKVAQELARHSSPSLTIGRYSHTRLHDLRGALDALPQSSDPTADDSTERHTLQATGTDAAPGHPDIAQRLAQRAQRPTLRIGANSGDESPLTVIDGETENAGESRRKELSHQGLATSGGHGIRRLRFSQLLGDLQFAVQPLASQGLSAVRSRLVIPGCYPLRRWSPWTNPGQILAA